MGTHCAGQTTDGRECRAYAVKASKFCFRHAPETRERYLETSRRGGSVQRWKGLGDVLKIVRGPLGAAALLEEITNKVLTGELPPHVANAAVSAINGLVNAYKVASSTQRGGKDVDSPVVLMHDDEPERYELVWDFAKERLGATKVEETDEEDPADVTETA